MSSIRVICDLCFALINANQYEIISGHINSLSRNHKSYQLAELLAYLGYLTNGYLHYPENFQTLLKITRQRLIDEGYNEERELRGIINKIKPYYE